MHVAFNYDFPSLGLEPISVRLAVPLRYLYLLDKSLLTTIVVRDKFTQSLDIHYSCCASISLAVLNCKVQPELKFSEVCTILAHMSL